MGIASNLERVFRPKKSKIKRATVVTDHLLKDLKDQIWPQNSDDSELTRAQKLQRYAVFAGGTAIFAYIFGHSKEGEFFSPDIKKQARSFKAGADIKGQKLIEIAGDFVAERFTGSDGLYVTSVITEVDVKHLRRRDLKDLERIINDQNQE